MEDGLINDTTHKCDQCEEVIKAFTSSGNVEFCTNCGARID